MKKLKYILTSILLMLAVCTPLMLTGCTKYYHIETFIREGSGDVTITSDNAQGGLGSSTVKSIVGKIVDAGNDQNFKYEVQASSDYEIKYIKENGEFVYNVDSSNNKFAPNNNTDVITCNITKEELNKDFKIEVAFRLRTVYLEYWYKDDSVAGGYSPLKVNGTVYTSEHQSGQAITLANGYADFNFILELNGVNQGSFNNGVTCINYSKDTRTGVVYDTGRLYTDKTLDELKAYLNIN